MANNKVLKRRVVVTGLGAITPIGNSVAEFWDGKTGNIYRGVGLCGVKNAVEEQFEGSISVDSEEGRGTKFHIEIPIAKLEEIE